MTILQTLALFVGGPLLIYGIIAVLTMVPGRARRHPRYRSGEPWDFPAQWWAGTNPVVHSDPALTGAGSEGGARGTW